MTEPTFLDLPVGELGQGPKVRAERIDLDHVARLRLAIDVLPPITVRRTPQGWKLVDGQHRLSAHKFEGRKTIRCEVVELDDSEALEVAVAVNVVHGLHLTIAERKTVARKLVADTDWSDQRIADSCGLGRTTVSELRPAPPSARPTSRSGKLDAPTPAKREGVDGKARPASKAEAQAQRERIADHLDEHPDHSLREVAEATGASAMTAASVRTEQAKAEPTERPAIGLAPPLDPEKPETLADKLIVWPKHGYRNESEFQASTAAMESAKFLDRYVVVVHEGDEDPFTLLSASVPGPWVAQAAHDARAMARHWTAFADAIENRPPLEVAR